MHLDLASLLKKYESLIPKDEITKKALIEVVRRDTGITLSPEEIDISTSGVFLSISPLKKSMLYARQHTLKESYHHHTNGIELPRVI